MTAGFNEKTNGLPRACAAAALSALFVCSPLSAQAPKTWTAAEHVPVNSDWQKNSAWMRLDPKCWQEFGKKQGVAKFDAVSGRVAAKSKTVCGLCFDVEVDLSSNNLWPKLSVFGPIGAGRHETTGDETGDFPGVPPFKSMPESFLRLNLGTVRPAAPNRAVEDFDQVSDWCHNELVFEYAAADEYVEPGQTPALRLIVSRLSPAVFFDNSSSATVFFAGGAPLPQHFAYESGGKIEVAGHMDVLQGLTGLNTRWVLAWYGSSSELLWPMHPVYCPARHVGSPELAGVYETLPSARNFSRASTKTPLQPWRDAPVLFVFAAPLESIEPDDSGGLRFSGLEDSIAGVVMPFFGHKFPPRERLASWKDGLPPEVAGQAGRLSDLMSRFPVSVIETYERDAESDRVVIREKFEFKTLRESGDFLAPVPPMLSIAAGAGFPVEFSAELADTGLLTPVGKWRGVKNVEEYTWSVAGLDRYVNPKPAPEPAHAAAERVRGLLAAEVEKILAAGHLAPFMAPVSTFQPSAGLYWVQPAETLQVLASVLDLLPPELAAKTAEYLKAERAQYPPESIVALPLGEGARREWWNFDAKTRKIYENAFRWERIPVSALYGLAAYYAAVEKQPPSDDAWRQCCDVLMSVAGAHDWASLGWFRFGAELSGIPGEVTEPGASGYPIGWYVDPAKRYDGGVMAANSYMAGIIGFLRMAQMRRDAAAQDFARGMLARAAAMRFAMGKFTGYLYDTGLCVLPKDPLWWVKYTQTDVGYMFTFDYSKPEHDLRQVVAMDEYGVFLLEQSQHYRTPYIVPFMRLVPETGAFLRDWLRDESMRYFDRAAFLTPDWFVSRGEAVLGGDKSSNRFVSEPHQLFMARAWIAGDSGGQLESYLDFPHAAIGDLYCISQLAETIRAYGNAGP